DACLTRRRRVGLDDIERAVADVGRISVHEVRGPATQRTRAMRQIAIMLAVELRVATAEVLARHFGLGSTAAVRVAARRGRVKTVADPTFAQLRATVLAAIEPAAQ